LVVARPIEELEGVSVGEIKLVEEIDPAATASLTIERTPHRRTGRKAAKDLTPERSTDTLQKFPKDISKTPVSNGEESEIGQFIADERAESPYERAVQTLASEALQDALEKLSYRARRVIELRYGLGGEDPRTRDEVGRTFNISRERIRQIENHSLKQLQYLHEA
jgi:RNA polymerase primary sigma factor